MSKAKKIAVKAIRKSAHISNKALHKTLLFTTRVENKATRIIDGTDFTYRINDVEPLEKVYYASVPYILPINPALPKAGQGPAVVLLIPSLDGSSFYGGTATALVVAAKMALFQKRPLRIVQTLKTGHPKDLPEFFKREKVDINPDDISIVSVADRAFNVYGYLPMHANDFFIASAWWDAYLINQLPIKDRFVYLVQDFEPIFYNNSDLYVLAESTYKMSSFVPLCNTRLMYDFMRDRKYSAFMSRGSYWFEPAVSRSASGFVRPKKTNQKKRLFLYGRPNVHRNLFFMALNSIDYAFKAGFLDPDEWELFMAGEDTLPDIKLTSGAVIRNKGKMKMEDYVNFSKTIDIAVSPMMAPHPNYPTLEFSSIGTQVVTTRYSNKQSLANYSDNIIMCDTDTESMAGAIRKATEKIPPHRQVKQSPTTSTLPLQWDISISDDLLERVIKSCQLR